VIFNLLNSLLENEYFAVIIGNLGAQYGKKEYTIQEPAANPADPDDHHGHHRGDDNPGNGPVTGGKVSVPTGCNGRLRGFLIT
jgi:hypothetical protein